MRDGAIHFKLYLLKLTMAVDNIVFRIIKGAFECSYQSLMYVFCTIPSNGHSSTALVSLIDDGSDYSKDSLFMDCPEN